MIPRKLLPNVLGLMGSIACSLALVGGTVAWAASPAVGEISLAIGVGRVVSSEGRATTVSRAMPVRVGDRIETERGGQIHVRFIDGAYVAVRPGSRLVVETYQYDAARPTQSAIRFRMEEGVVRVISGKGAEAARARFRLNTPIAAIGVQGTDFVVQAEADVVRVAVHSGAVVLAPLGEGCVADALGPCSTASARALSAEMGRVMLEFQRQQGTPRIVPINGVLPPDRPGTPAPQETRGIVHTAQTTTNEPQTEVLAAQAVGGQVQPPALPTEPPVVTPLPAIPVASVVWGRWSQQPWPGDTTTLTLADAGVGRVVTVGNGTYTLFRPESSLTSLVSNLGRVDFNLRDAQVHLLRGNGAEAARVDNAWLSVDFGARQFSTAVAMSHPQVGSASLQAAGSVREDGAFGVRTADGRVAGALTLEGKEAGYFFERTVPGGMFSGITRWWSR